MVRHKEKDVLRLAKSTKMATECKALRIAKKQGNKNVKDESTPTYKSFESVTSQQRYFHIENKI
jgi:hypothetical protein